MGRCCGGGQQSGSSKVRSPELALGEVSLRGAWDERASGGAAGYSHTAMGPLGPDGPDVEMRLSDVVDGMSDAEVVLSGTGLGVDLEVEFGFGGGAAEPEPPRLL